MFWLALPALAAVGVGAWIYSSVSEKEKQAERRWREKRKEVEKTLEEHRANIDAHINQVQESYDFHFLVDMHYSSVKIADAAHQLLADARESVNGINKMLGNAKQKKMLLEAELENAKQQHNKSEFHKIIKELKLVNEIRRELFTQKDILVEQKDNFYIEVKRFNLRTSELKQCIRHRCGNRGLEWYENLERRKALRNNQHNI